MSVNYPYTSTAGQTPGAQLLPAEYETFNESTTQRAHVKLNGKNYSIKSYMLTFNAHGATDTGTVEIAQGGNPDFTIELYRAINNPTPVYIEVYHGFVPDSGVPTYTRRFYGIVDQYELAPEQNLVTFQLRSLCVPLVDTRIASPFQNVSTVAFMQQQCSRFGITFQYDLDNAPATMTEVMAQQYVSGVRQFFIWDVFLMCALHDDADFWFDHVSGVLHYTSPDKVTRTLVDVKYGRDVKGVSITHSPQFNKNIEVEVRTYNPKTRVSHISRTSSQAYGGIETVSSTRVVTSNPVPNSTEIVRTSISSTGAVTTTTSNTSGGTFTGTSSAGAAESTKERYVFYIPNITPQRALQLSQQFHRQISMHEYAIVVDLPMLRGKYPLLNIVSLVRLHGTQYMLANSSNSLNAAINPAQSTKANDYWPRRITESFDTEQGGTWKIEAVNHALPQGAI